MLSREGNRNKKEKGTAFRFGAKDLSAQQSGGLGKANAVCLGLLLAKLGYLCCACGRRFKLECTGWQQTAQNQKNGDLNFITCLLHTKSDVSTMLVTVVSKNYNSFVVCNSGALVQGLSFLWVKQFSHAKIRLLRFINLAKCGTLSVTKIFLMPVDSELQWLCSCWQAELCW